MNLKGQDVLSSGFPSNGAQGLVQPPQMTPRVDEDEDVDVILSRADHLMPCNTTPRLLPEGECRDLTD